MARTSEISTSEPGSVPTMGRGVQLLLLALGALVLHYVANARPQVATAAPAPHSLSAVHYPAQAAA